MNNLISFFKEKKKHVLKFVGLLFIIISNATYSQHEFFHEITLEKKLIENEKWEVIGEANFKHLYDEPAWRRWGMSFASVRKMKGFNLLGGFNGYYTFNRDITNFFEMRPWAAFQLKLPIFAHVTLRQQLKYEWRHFYTEEEPTTKENYGRLRYQIGIDIPIPDKKESSWTIRPYFEWFFIKDPAEFERFSNERDFGLMAIKRFNNEHKLSFGFTREVYYDLYAEREFGYLLFIGYSL